MKSENIAVGLLGLSKSYGKVEAVKPLDLDVRKGDFLAILGPSGCGKTTLLRMIGGFVEPTAGRILVEGVDVTRLPPEARPTNMVFQGYGLFPHMNVRQNIAYGLKLKKLPADKINEQVARMLALVRLESLSERMSGELSGGQQQRVAVARALVMEPPVLLLDEPFAALDLKLRQAMQDELRRIHREVGGTFVFVTHDQTEALALANRIAVMNDGRLEQIGTPEEMYLRPASRFVAQFIGEANVLNGKRHGGTVTTATELSFRNEGTDGDVILVIRPEHAHLTVKPGADESSVSGLVDEATFFGSHVRYTVLLGSGERINVHAPVTLPVAAQGQQVTVAWPRAVERVIDA